MCPVKTFECLIRLIVKLVKQQRQSWLTFLPCLKVIRAIIYQDLTTYYIFVLSSYYRIIFS